MKIAQLINRRYKNGDKQLTLPESGVSKETFVKVDKYGDGFLNKNKIEDNILKRIESIENVLSVEPNKLLKMMRKLGPEVVDSVGGKAAYEKIIDNPKFLIKNQKGADEANMLNDDSKGISVML